MNPRAFSNMNSKDMVDGSCGYLADLHFVAIVFGPVAELYGNVGDVIPEHGYSNLSDETCGVDKLQILPAGAVRTPQGNFAAPAAPEGLGGEIRGINSRGSPTRMRDMDPP